MTERRWFAILCGLLIFAALGVSLCNVSAFALLFEPNALLSWAWAVYVDFALVGYTIAFVYLRARQQRTGIVRFGFYWFVALSLIANVTVVLSRYDVSREATLIADALSSDAFLFAACVAYGASIPLSVLTFAHTIADAFAAKRASVPLDEYIAEQMRDPEFKREWEASEPVYEARRAAIKSNSRSMAAVIRAARQAQPNATKAQIRDATGLSASTVRKWWEVTA